MTTVTIPNDWRPRPYQMPLWTALENGTKRAVAVWHRRAGKDSLCVNWTACATHERVGLYWHMAPSAKQVRKIIWNGIDKHGRRIIDQAFPKELRARTNDQEMLIEFKNGSIWQCVGSDNYDSLVGANPVGVVFSEYSLANPTAWDFLRPILLENGGWALFIYTPRGRNHGSRLYEMARKSEGWFAELLTVRDTNAIPLELVEADRREIIAETGSVEDADAIIQQEYFGSFDAAIRGAFYGPHMARLDAQGRFTRVPFDPTYPVVTAWDIGITDSTAIWFAQPVGREIRLIDYMEASGQGVEHYAKALREKPYDYAEHILPHDADASEFTSGTTTVGALKKLGLKNLRVLSRYAVQDGINAVRLMLPKCVFDDEACARGIDALRQYQREWNDDTKTFKDKPLHDWTSHAADAFRYLAHGIKTDYRGRDTFRPQVADDAYQMFG